MRIPRIYTPQDLQLSTTLILEEQASHHLIRVLRLQERHPIIVFNGQGGSFQGEISIAHKKHTHVNLTNFHPNNANSHFSTHIAIGLSKADKIELIIQKATELGVHSISPITTDHSDVRINPEREEKQCNILTLGQRILRAETAPIASLGAVQTLWGDW